MYVNYNKLWKLLIDKNMMRMLTSHNFPQSEFSAKIKAF